MQTRPESKIQTPSGVARQTCINNLTTPAVLSAVAYPVVRNPQGTRAKHRPTRMYEASEGRELGANQAGTMYLAPASTVQEGARLSGTSNKCEPALKLGYAYQPKVRYVAGLGMDTSLSIGCTQTTKSPRGKQDSNPLLSLMLETGKSVCLWLNPEGEPQGDLIGKRIKDCGKSERIPVMGVIGTRLVWNPATSFQRETVLTSTRSVITRELVEPSQRRVSK